jgi:hypothetical protein
MKLVIPAVFTAVDKFSGPLSKMQNNVGGFANKIQSAGSSAMAVGRSTALLGVALAAPLIIATKAAVEFEDKMADVAKTTGLSGDALAKFGTDLLKLAPGTRTSIEELQAIAEIGGQLGIAQEDLLAFTKASNLVFNSGLNATPSFNGNNLTSVLDGDISCIHNLSYCFSLPALLLINVT